MLRDLKNEAWRNWPQALKRFHLPDWVKGRRWRWGDVGLPAKLLLLTSVFVLLAEILIFLPSLSNFRLTWLN